VRDDRAGAIQIARISMSDLYFDDFSLGQTFESPFMTVTREQIVDFAKAFDPNPFHHDEEAAQEAGYPCIIASGFHILSLSFRLFFDLNLWSTAILPSPGLAGVKFVRPLFPGQTIRIRAEVLEAIPSRSKPEQGLLRFRHDTLVDTGEVILTAECLHRLRRHG
jgi:acyl dehydratase